ncbi:MAG: hypothetical protein ACPG77_05070, partial [Nannocystaceae bacterium]
TSFSSPGFGGGGRGGGSASVPGCMFEPGAGGSLVGSKGAGTFTSPGSGVDAGGSLTGCGA